VRQLDVDDLGTGVPEPGDALLPQRSISSGMPSTRYSRGIPIFMPLTEPPRAAS
jgi:hypothetical protein